MSATGYLQVRIYESYAQIPLRDVAVSISTREGTNLAMDLTDRSGKIRPIAIPAPELADSQQPEAEQVPYTTVSLIAGKHGYELVRVDQVQIFANTVTLQEIMLIPMPEMPAGWMQTETFRTPPQNL